MPADRRQAWQITVLALAVVGAIASWFLRNSIVNRFNANGAAVNGTFTFNLHGTGSDGSTLNVHQVDHFNTTPTGAEFFFTHCHD